MGKETRKMENTKDQYIGAEIHSARSVNPDGETVTLDGDTVVWTVQRRRTEFTAHTASNL